MNRFFTFHFSSGIVGLALLDDCLGGLGPTGRAMVSGATNLVMGTYSWLRPSVKSGYTKVCDAEPRTPHPRAHVSVMVLCAKCFDSHFPTAASSYHSLL